MSTIIHEGEFKPYHFQRQPAEWEINLKNRQLTMQTKQMTCGNCFQRPTCGKSKYCSVCIRAFAELDEDAAHREAVKVFLVAAFIISILIFLVVYFFGQPTGKRDRVNPQPQTVKYLIVNLTDRYEKEIVPISG